jgi:hypothetical protein
MMCLSAVAEDKASSKPTDAELAAITARGQLLAEYDQAAWHATDAVLATHPKEGTPNRYIAHKTEVGWVVDFGNLNASGSNFVVTYEAVQTGGQYGGWPALTFTPAPNSGAPSKLRLGGLPAIASRAREGSGPP